MSETTLWPLTIGLPVLTCVSCMIGYTCHRWRQHRRHTLHLPNDSLSYRILPASPHMTMFVTPSEIQPHVGFFEVWSPLRPLPTIEEDQRSQQSVASSVGKK